MGRKSETSPSLKTEAPPWYEAPLLNSVCLHSFRKLIMSREYFVLQALIGAATFPHCYWKVYWGGGRQIDLSQEERGMKRAVIGAAVVCFFVFCSTTIWAQGTAQISGTAKDQSGAVLPGVEITATQTETRIT